MNLVGFSAWLQYGALGLLGIFLALAAVLGRGLLQRLQDLIDRNQVFMERIVTETMEGLKDQSEAYRSLATDSIKGQQEMIGCWKTLTAQIDQAHKDREREHRAHMEEVSRIAKRLERGAPGGD